MNLGFTRDTSGLTAVRTQAILEIGKATTEEEAKDKNIGTIAEDNLLILRQAAMKLRQEEEDVDVEKGRKITESAVTTPPPLIYPEAPTSPSGLNVSIHPTMRRHPKGKNLTIFLNSIKTTRK